MALRTHGTSCGYVELTTKLFHDLLQDQRGPSRIMSPGWAPCSCEELLVAILLNFESSNMTRVCLTGVYLYKVCISYIICIPLDISKRGAGWNWWSVSYPIPRPSCGRWHGDHDA